MNGAPEARDGADPNAESGLLEVRDLVKHFPIKTGVIFDHEIGRVRAVDGVSAFGHQRAPAWTGAAGAAWRSL